MKWNYDIVINVSDENRIKGVKYERISGNNRIKLLMDFFLTFNRILEELHELEIEEMRRKVNEDDIPF